MKNHTRRLQKLEEVSNPKSLELTPDLTHAIIDAMLLLQDGTVVNLKDLRASAEGYGVLPTTPQAMIDFLSRQGFLKFFADGTVSGTERFFTWRGRNPKSPSEKVSVPEEKSKPPSPSLAGNDILLSRKTDE